MCVTSPCSSPLVDASWLPIYEESEDAVDFILAFVSSLDKDTHKFTFLKSTYVVCKTALKRGLTRGLDLFCQTCEVVENIKDLLDKEPRDRLSSKIRYLAMITIEELSLVENVLEGKTKILLSACFSSVLLLPSEREMPHQNTALYIKTLKAMDTMLRTVVLSFPASSVSKELQDIFEMLLEYTRFEREAVRERAMGRIAVLTNLLSNYSTLKPSVNFGRDSSGPVRPEDISFPAMGRLVGRLILFRYSGEQTSYTAFHALFSLAEFLYKSRPRDGSDVFSWEALTTSSLCYLSIIDCTQAFGRYLHSSERTDVVLEAIEAMKDPSILNKDVPCSILDVVMEDTDFWVTDVPKTVKCIFENLLYATTEAGCVKVESLFLLMTTQYPSAVVISLCEMALQGDSTLQELCDTLSSKPDILDKFLAEFATLHRNQWCNPPREGTRASHRTSSLGQVDLEELGEEPNVWSNQGNPDVMTAFLMLEVLLGLSERMEMGKKIEAFLPSMMKILEVGSEDEKLKIIEVFRNVLSQLKKSKASSIAVALVGKILPLFDSESVRLRELSLWLLRDLVRSVARRDEKKMRKQVQSALIPLLFRVNDQVPSVAKASREALFAAAELLKWKQLKHLLQKERMWELAECLIKKRRSRVEKFMYQSLPYLRDPQSPVRLAAVRFIGCATRHMRDQDIETQAHILTALQPLERDKDISISSLAAHTGLLLRAPRVQRRSSVILHTLCCWCR
ncbi:protein MROH8 [Zonotrichia leucophrys gambelii]|uniref:protein MROH8 n=1 Tax=Zonotrichia leucophrys gambelii TaxID=257770 RepID=UPI00313FF174